MRKNSKILSFLLAFALVFSFSSISSFAWSGDTWESTEGVSVYVDGSQVGSTVLYDSMDSQKSSNSYTYSTVNTYGTTKSYTGQVYTLEQLLLEAGVTDWLSYPGNTKITFTAPDSFKTSVLKSQLDETRYVFPSEEQVAPAFMKITKRGSTYFKFMFGQMAPNDQNNQIYIDFKGANGSNGNGRIDIDTQNSPTQMGKILAYKNADTTAFTNGSTINITTSDKLRFNIYDTRYLNKAKIYYEYGMGSVNNPSIYTSDIYNVRAPKWCSPSEQGANYPYYIQFNAPGTYTVKLMSYCYGMLSSNVYTFTVIVT